MLPVRPSQINYTPENKPRPNAGPQQLFTATPSTFRPPWQEKLGQRRRMHTKISFLLSPVEKVETLGPLQFTVLEMLRDENSLAPLESWP